MRPRQLSILALLAFALALLAQTNLLIPRPANLAREYDLEGQFIPASATTVIDQDIWLTGLTLTNNTTTDIQCSVTDLQGSPIPLVPNTAAGAILAGSVYNFTFPKTKMKGGIVWSCSTGGVVAARLSGYIK